MLVEIITTLNWLILWYFIILSGGYLILLLVSVPDVFNRFKEVKVGDISYLTKSYTMPPVTIIIPAFNEQSMIIECVKGILNSTYQNVFIIIVNDGSTDNTLERLKNEFLLFKTTPLIPPIIDTSESVKGYYISNAYKSLIVIDKEHTDRSDSLNMGVNACRTPLFVTIDADTIIEPPAIGRIVYYMLMQEHAVAVGGAVYILNGCTYKDGKIIQVGMSKNIIHGLQACEYMRSFLFSRSGWNFFGGALCYAGAFTLFEHKAVIGIGGFDLGNPAQDFEIITHLQEKSAVRKKAFDVCYTPAAIAWTDVPGTLKELWVQRHKWQCGILRSLMLHKNMLFNPTYGVTGLYTYTFFLFGETLGPVIECLAYCLAFLSWYLGILSLKWLILMLLICFGFVTFLTLATALMSFTTYNRYRRTQDLLWLMGVMIVENFGFRQIIVICRVKATWQYMWNKMKGWGKKIED